MDPTEALLSAGFDRVIRLDASEWNIGEQGTLLLAFRFYQPAVTEGAEAVIHSYYPASQQAYLAARQIAQAAQAEGMNLVMRDDIRVKPIFARLPGFSQGRNTISYLPEQGSRFHVQILLWDRQCMPDFHPQPEKHQLHCGECRLCMEVCPTHAIDDAGFHRERCLRNWQMNGQAVPEPLRAVMSSRLIGCDECQRHCPHNCPPEEKPVQAALLEEILSDPKRVSKEKLAPFIGSNLAIPNRVLAQTLLLAGAQKRADLLEKIRLYEEHPSPVVSEHARWAEKQIQENTDC